MARTGIPRTFALVLLLLALQILPACNPTQSGPPGRRVPLRVCYSALTATQIPLLYAVDEGFFDSLGLAVELFYFDSGTDAVTSLIAGETDLCQVAGSSVVNAVAAGEDLVFLAGLFNTYVYSFIVAPDVSGPEDLRGESVAISRLGSSSDTAIRIALKSLGLTPDEDVAVLAIGDQSARLAALESGQIAGTVISIPESARALQQGFRELLDMSTLNAPYQHTSIAAPRSFVEEHREEVVLFMRGMLEAIGRMKQDPASVTRVLADRLQLDPVKDADLLSAAYEALILIYLPDMPYPTEAGIQTLLDELVANNPDAGGLEAAGMVDTTVLEDAQVMQNPE